ncbi:MAG: LacI family DNA-binding transcriptional regulator [Firmicutes bacterium]|nr:LacI family DNA-binding transcriptional regulator [Bacillota bacterium]
MKVTIKDVAKFAGVSIGTVSAVLNNKSTVSEESRRKVNEAIQKLGYRSNASARRLVLNRSENIAVILNGNSLSSSSYLFYAAVIKGIVRELAPTRYQVTLVPLWETGGRQTEFPAAIQNRDVDGILVLDVMEREALFRLRDLEVPIVLVDNHGEYPEFPGVDNDDETGIYKVTRHVIGLGHSRIAFINAPLSHPLGRQAWLGFKRALEESNLPILPGLLATGNIEMGSGYEAVKAILERGSDFSAVVSANDSMAIGSIRGINEAGLKVPDDVVVVGMDDIEISEHSQPPLTTVRIRREEMGRRAAQLLIGLVEGSWEGPTRIVLDNELIIRESCAARLKAISGSV